MTRNEIKSIIPYQFMISYICCEFNDMVNNTAVGYPYVNFEEGCVEHAPLDSSTFDELKEAIHRVYDNVFEQWYDVEEDHKNNVIKIYPKLEYGNVCA